VNVEDGRSTLECDEETLPPNEQATATFQFLVEQKARTHGFRGGGEYANEVLRNCLFSVFADAEPGEQKALSDFYPLEGEGGDQLAPGEAKRIKDAIAALVEDLERGGACALVRDSSGTGFTWLEDAASRFRPTAAPQPQEKELAEKLRRQADAVPMLARGGALNSVLAAPDLVEVLKNELDEQLANIGRTRTPLPVEEARATASRLEAEVGRVLGQVFDEHRSRVATRLERELVALETAALGSAWTVDTQSDLPGEIVLVYGEDERVGQAVQSFLQSPPRRAFVVQVGTFGGTSTWHAEEVRLFDTWRALLGTDGGPATASRSLPLHENLRAGEIPARWGEATADELVFGALWVEQPEPSETDAPAAPPGPFALKTGSGTDATFATQEEAIRAWAGSTDAALCWVSSQLNLAAVAHVLATPTSAGDPALITIPADLATQLLAQDAPDASALARLLAARRVVVGLDPDELFKPNPGALRDLSRKARLLVEWRPDEYNVFSDYVEPAGKISTLRASSHPEEALELGRLVDQWDPEQAHALIMSAAEAGLPQAMSALAFYYYDRDPDAAQAWRKRLVDTRAWGTVEELADSISPRDRQVARDLYTRAAEGGSPSAMRWLALETVPDAESQGWRDRLIETDETGTEIERLAVELSGRDTLGERKLYEAAAERGSDEARIWLATELIEEEPDTARAWRDRLVKSGPPWMIERVSETLRERAPVDARAFDTQLAEERGSAAAIGRLVFDLLDEQREPWLWVDRLLATNDATEIKSVVERLLEKRPDLATDLAEHAGTIETSPEAVRAVVEAMAAVDPKLAQSLKASAEQQSA
jgi:TPR repeat protein